MSMDEKDSYTYDSFFIDKLLSNLQSLRENQTFVDTDLIVDDKIIKAHRILLAGSSCIFKAMLNGNSLENLTNKIDLSGKTSFKCLKNIINYIYSGKIVLTYENVSEIYRLACFLMIDPLIDITIKFMCKTINISNCFEIHELGQLFCSKELLESSQLFFNQNFKEVVNQPQFERLNFEHLLYYLTCDEIEVTSELEVVKAVGKWINFDRNSRIGYLIDLLFSSRLCSIDLLEIKKIFCRLNIISKLDVNYSKNEASVNSTVFLNELQRKCNILLLGKIDKQSNSERKLNVEYYDEFIIKESIQLVMESISNDCLFQCPKILHKPRNCLNRSKVLMIVGGLCKNETSNVCLVSKLTSDCKLSDEYKWIQVAKMNYASEDHCLVNVNLNDNPFFECCYVFGGFNNIYGVLSSAEMFLPNRNCWELISPMSKARKLASAVLLKKYIYVCGGLNDQLEALSDLEVYDIEKNKWLTCALMPIGRYGHNCLTDGSKIFVIGGIQESSVHIYVPTFDESYSNHSINEGHWISIDTNSNSPSSSGGAIFMNRSIADDSFILFFGGKIPSTNQGLNQLISFHIYRNKLSSLNVQLNCFRWRFAYAAIDSIVYLIGGKNNDGELNSIERIDLIKSTSKIEETKLPYSLTGSQAAFLSLPLGYLI